MLTHSEDLRFRGKATRREFKYAKTRVMVLKVKRENNSKHKKRQQKYLTSKSKQKHSILHYVFFLSPFFQV